MNNIITIKNVRGYLDKNGTAHLNLEDVAKGLGIVQKQNKNGKEYESIRWERIANYLIEFGFPHGMGEESKTIRLENNGLPDFIPENIFYKLCFKASNEVAKKFQDIVCDEILPTIRKTGTYSTETYQKKSTSIGEITNLIKTLRGIMKDENHLPEDIANMAQIICTQFNVILPQDFVKKSPYKQISLTIDFERM